MYLQQILPKKAIKFVESGRTAHLHNREKIYSFWQTIQLVFLPPIVQLRGKMVVHILLFCQSMTYVYGLTFLILKIIFANEYQQIFTHRRCLIKTTSVHN